MPKSRNKRKSKYRSCTTLLQKSITQSYIFSYTCSSLNISDPTMRLLITMSRVSTILCLCHLASAFRTVLGTLQCKLFVYPLRFVFLHMSIKPGAYRIPNLFTLVNHAFLLKYKSENQQTHTKVKEI